MKKVIIIGASEGIGRELARLYAKEQFAVGIASRRAELLEQLKDELGGNIRIMPMDVSKTDEAKDKFNALVELMGGADIVVICAGTGYENPELKWELEETTIDVNVKGFTCIADAAFRYFVERKAGQLAGISSVAALRGSALCPAYNASKAYVSNYMEGLRCKAAKISRDIIVTDIKPGFVDTKMAQGENLFWVASPQKAAGQIAALISKGKTHGYVTKRWGLVAFLFRVMPDWLYRKLP
jgi:short-subunit dehydrogenase